MPAFRELKRRAGPNDTAADNNHVNAFGQGKIGLEMWQIGSRHALLYAARPEFGPVGKSATDRDVTKLWLFGRIWDC